MSNLSAPIAFDMYGHPIYPLGETGFGVSITFFSEGPEFPPKYPWFSIFHESDDFQQSLFSAELNLNGPHICNAFEDRIAEHFKNELSLLGAPKLREGEL